jgi:hypothetical protein
MKQHDQEVRNAALEEVAKVVEDYRNTQCTGYEEFHTINSIVHVIRAMKEGEEAVTEAQILVGKCPQCFCIGFHKLDCTEG